jgi:arsenate reductase
MRRAEGRMSDDKITIYEKPTCSTCREAVHILRESGVEFDKVNYIIEPLGEEKLRELIAKMGIAPRELLRTKEAVYRELNPDKRELKDDEAIALMVEHPELMQRPIIERGERAALGRPLEKIKELLGD